jgi:hypothetical protein
VTASDLELAELYLYKNNLEYVVVEVKPIVAESRVPIYEINLLEDEDAMMFEILGGEPEFRDNLIKWWES